MITAYDSLYSGRSLTLTNTFESHQPLQHKLLGVIKALYHWVNTLISKEDDKTMEKDRIN